MKSLQLKLLIMVAAALLAPGCTAQPGGPALPAQVGTVSVSSVVEYTLKSGAAGGQLVYVGVGGEIEGLINPDLIVNSGETVRIVFLNGDGISHDLALPDASAQTPLVLTQGDSQDLELTLDKPGTYAYLCTVSGHRQAGMEGKLIVQEP